WGYDDQGVTSSARGSTPVYARHGRQELQVSPARPRHVAELQLVAAVRDITGRQSVVACVLHLAEDHRQINDFLCARIVSRTNWVCPNCALNSRGKGRAGAVSD